MNFKTTDYINVREKLSSFGVETPTDLIILPRLFDSVESQAKMYHESSSSTVLKLFKEAKIGGTIFQPNAT